MIVHHGRLREVLAYVTGRMIGGAKYQWSVISRIVKAGSDETAPIDADSARMSMLAEACSWDLRAVFDHQKSHAIDANAAARLALFTPTLLTPSELTV